MSFWQENYAFIKDVYDTKSSKLLELMEKTDKSIAEVTDEKKLYTSAEFKKVKETFTVGTPMANGKKWPKFPTRLRAIKSLRKNFMSAVAEPRTSDCKNHGL